MEKIVRTGEIACNKQFLLFSQCFLHFKMSSAICFNLDQSKILPSGNELTHSHTMTPFQAPGKQAF